MTAPWLRNLRAKLLIGFAVTLLPLLILLIWFDINRYQNQKTEALALNRQLAAIMAADFESFVNDVLRTELSVGKALGSQQWTPRELDGYLSATAAAYPNVRYVLWLSPDGIVLGASSPSLGVLSLAGQPNVQAVLAGAEWSLSPLVPSMATADLGFLIVRAIRNEEGVLTGVVAAEIDPGGLGLVLEGSQETQTFLFDSQGTLAYTSVAPRLPPDERQGATVTALASVQSNTAALNPFSHEPLVYASAPVGNLGWTAGIGRPAATVFDAARTELIQDILTLLAALGLAAAVAIILSHQLARPVEALRTAANAWSQGHYAVRASVESTDEIGQLAQSFNEMAEQIALRDQKLRAEADRLQAIIDHVPEAILIVNAGSGRIRGWNAQARNLFGLAAAGDRPWYVYDLPLRPAHPERAENEHPLTALLQTGGRREFTVSEDDRRQVLIGQALPLTRLDNAQEQLWVFFDVTALWEVDQLKSELLSIASHELRTPLTSIHGLSQLALREAERQQASPEQIEDLRAIVAQAERMARLIRRLLDLARLEQGRFTLERGRVDLAQMVQERIEQERRLSSSHTFRLAVADAPLIGEWDADRVLQVLDNLLDNAEKYSPPDSEIAISLRQTGDRAELRVRDHGIGIPAEQQATLFERYYRARNVGAQRGLGLGLYVSRQIVEAHGGTIQVESEVDKGTTVIVRLPLLAAALPAGGPPREADSRA